jgi:hypothetical protein
VEYALVVGFHCAQYGKDDSGELVSGSCDRLGLAEFSDDPSEELAQVVFSMVE